MTEDVIERQSHNDFSAVSSEIGHTSTPYHQGENQTSYHLPYVFCLLLDFDGHHDACNSDRSSCVTCVELARNFLQGEEEDTGSPVSVLIWATIFLVGLLGIVANTFIIFVLSRNKAPKAFDNLLVILAIFDLICCVMTIVASTGIITFLENWNRGYDTLNCVYWPFCSALFARSGSAFTTVAIAAERYLFVAHPEKGTSWFTGTRGKFVALAVLILTLLLNIPRFTSFSVIPNNHTEIKPLSNLTSVIWPRHMMERFWFGTMHKTHDYIDFWLPFPLTLIFLVMMNLEVKKITKTKKALQVTRQRDIREVHVFVPVIAVFFISSILPITHYVYVNFLGLIHRELALLMLLCAAFNASVKLPIYYTRGYTFRKDARALLFHYVGPNRAST